jgi:hypothetical protein
MIRKSFFFPADAIGSVDLADFGMQAFGRVSATDQADVLALMLASGRD